MTVIARPAERPDNTHFSSGPCTKRPGWSLENLQDACLGRSHRAKDARTKLKLAIDKTRALLGVPEEYLIGIVPGSDTGAMEMALWSLLGPCGVDTLAWESFGKGWVTDVVQQLRIEDVRVIDVPYGLLPDLAKVDFAHDVVFAWNGTTSGVRVPDGDWIASNREGLTICDATSAVFAQRLDWPKLDAVTYSWQKVLGGEAAHGMLILSPRAVERLESHEPAWPMPKIFRLTKDGALIKEVFEGATINTPSMLCVEDYLDTLHWAERIGGLDALIARADANAKIIAGWVARTGWIDYLAEDPATRSNTSICLKVVDPEIISRPREDQAAFAKRLAWLLEAEGVALDIGAHRDAPPGLRIWAGSTVESQDLTDLMPWLDWAFLTAKGELAEAA